RPGSDGVEKSSPISSSERAFSASGRLSRTTATGSSRSTMTSFIRGSCQVLRGRSELLPRSYLLRRQRRVEGVARVVRGPAHCLVVDRPEDDPDRAHPLVVTARVAPRVRRLLLLERSATLRLAPVRGISDGPVRVDRP